jgi:hypothetical protein
MIEEIPDEIPFDEPKDIRALIKQWITDACTNGQLPFKKDGGIIVQLLNTWLRSYEAEKQSELEERIEALENNKGN